MSASETPRPESHGSPTRRRLLRLVRWFFIPGRALAHKSHCGGRAGAELAPTTGRLARGVVAEHQNSMNLVPAQAADIVQRLGRGLPRATAPSRRLRLRR
jgi:hypothetical protein